MEAEKVYAWDQMPPTEQMAALRVARILELGDEITRLQKAYAGAHALANAVELPGPYEGEEGWARWRRHLLAAEADIGDLRHQLVEVTRQRDAILAAEGKP